VPEGDQRGVDAVLQRRAVTEQMQPKAGQLTLTADRRSGSQIAMTPKRYMFGLSTDAAPAPARESMG
jgi:hypothetical protein